MLYNLYNHYDVVPPEPYEQWRTPPFEPAVTGECIVARGVAVVRQDTVKYVIICGLRSPVISQVPETSSTRFATTAQIAMLSSICPIYDLRRSYGVSASGRSYRRLPS